MKKLINRWYRNHALLYKVLLFLCTTFVIVYLFPKGGKFKYNFDKSKPWQSENLYAPFNFALKKSNEEIKSERKAITENSIVYFDFDQSVKSEVFKAYETKFRAAFS